MVFIAELSVFCSIKVSGNSNIKWAKTGKNGVEDEKTVKIGLEDEKTVKFGVITLKVKKNSKSMLENLKKWNFQYKIKIYR